MLEHGGRLRAAAAQSRIPLADWLDLSTGINPHGYPLPAPPATIWQRLPEEDDGLEAAAAAYYGNTALLPVAGSQAAIQLLPRILGCTPSTRVALLAPSYAEHAHAWRQQRCHFIPASSAGGDVCARIEQALTEHDIVVLIHPNNPDGSRFPPARLHAWQQQLAARGAWLIIDEAFIDTEPAASLTPQAGGAGLIILRSLGKFFGLAGARVGFVFAPEQVRNALARELGPWTLSGPARWAAQLALRDHAWQQATRARLQDEGERLRALLQHHGLPPDGGSALFQYLRHPHASALHAALARHGILVRLFDPGPLHARAGLRFGLPSQPADWQRLDLALHHILKEFP